MTQPAVSGTPGQVTVLVVDDTSVDRRITGGMVARELGWRVVYADNGRAALTVLEREKPDIVLTDMHMPEMDGLKLVMEVRKKHPLVPVVLMTAFGNEDLAIQALQQGAASYVPKKRLERDLASTLEQVLWVGQGERQQQHLLERLTRGELHFTLDNDPASVVPLVSHLQQYLSRLNLCDQTGTMRIGIALEEALLNAMFHGNLELSAELRQEGEQPFRALIEQRRRQLPYSARRVLFTAILSPEEVRFVIGDEGPGFDPGALPNPTDPANLDGVSGRGLMLIRTFMDEVVFNPKGNEITLIKRRESR